MTTVMEKRRGRGYSLKKDFVPENRSWTVKMPRDSREISHLGGGLEEVFSLTGGEQIH
jgi:hypothetical protein